MNAFTDNLSTTASINYSRTENSGLTYNTSGSANLDLFGKIGASRGKDIIPDFVAAYAENRETALRMALWARDVRGGQGERKIFRDIMNYLEVNHPEDMAAILPKVAEVGRWDDLLVLKTPHAKEMAHALIYKALSEGNGLVAKWLPRQGPIARELALGLGITKPGDWRRLVVSRTDVVEQKMCAKDWEAINLSHVPSLATIRYNKAFERHIPQKMTKFAKDVSEGKVKVNASAVYPYEVVHTVFSGYGRTANQVAISQGQWDNLKDFVPEGNKFLPLVDVSGSMMCSIPNQQASVLEVAVALGLYVSERNKSAFKDTLLTFSAKPRLFKATGSLTDRIDITMKGEWGMSTNIEAAFNEILRHAVKHKVSAEDMPDALIIFSDMEFNSCTRGTAYDTVSAKYAEAGYSLPRVIFWNLASRGGRGGNGNSPITIHDKNTSLVSGFSPSTMATVFGGKGPIDVMNNTLYVERYDLAA